VGYLIDCKLVYNFLRQVVCIKTLLAFNTHHSHFQTLFIGNKKSGPTHDMLARLHYK